MGVPLPAGVRPPLAIPHARSDEPLYGNVPFALGVARRRRLRSRAPQTATLQWRLPLPQLALWNTWYEDTLLAGALAFDVPVQGRLAAPGLETLEVRFAAPPRREISGAWAVISGEVVGAVAVPEAAGNIAWFEAPINNSTGVATLGSSGSDTEVFGAFYIYAGVVGYSGQVVVWSGSWTPIGDDPSPDLFGNSPDPGKAEIFVPEGDDIWISSWGTYTLSATIDGVPATQQLELAITPGGYQLVSWQEAP